LSHRARPAASEADAHEFEGSLEEAGSGSCGTHVVTGLIPEEPD